MDTVSLKAWSFWKGKAFVRYASDYWGECTRGIFKTINVNTLHEVIIQYLFLNSYLTNVIKKVGWKKNIYY